MSRAVLPDFEFDKDKFTELLNKAQGRLTLTDYAAECGVSLAYLCKYLKGKFDKAPTPSTIRKMAKFTGTNGVTEEELLEAAGYSATKYSDANNLRNIGLRFEKLGIATIASALSKCNFKWNVKQTVDSTSLFDLAIQVDAGEIENWMFNFITRIDDNKPPVPYNGRFFTYYTKLVCMQHPPKSKYSFVTNSEVLYNEIKMYNPHMLPMYISIILINTEDMKVVKEEYLETHIPVTDNIKNIYTLK